MTSKIKNELAKYQPFNEQEESDKTIMLKALEDHSTFSRENTLCHFTASSWVVNENKDKVLMGYHRQYDSWTWLGGHADGEEDLLKVAIKEAKEESGLKVIKPVTYEIFSIEVLPVEGHFKKNHYVSSHLHLNVTYLLEANEEEPLIVKEDEQTDLAWFSVDDVIEASSEKWVKETIYTKLNQKLKWLTT